MVRFALITGGVGLGVVGLVVVSAAGGVYWLTTESGNAFLKDKVLEQAGPAIPEGKLELDGLRTDLFTHIELTGVALSTPSGKPMVSAKALRLSYDLSHILDTRVDVTEVALIEPVVDVEVLEDGNLDIAAAFGPSAPAEPDPGPPAPWIDIPADIRVGSVRLTDGAVRYRDGSNKEAPLDVSVGGLQLSGAAAVGGRTASLSKLHLELATLSGLGVDVPLPISLDSSLEYDNSTLKIAVLKLLAHRTGVELDGTVDRVDFEDRVLHLALKRIHADEGDVETLAQDDVLLGDLDVSGTLTGPLSDLTAALDLTTPGGPLSLTAWTDTTAQPLAWKVDAATPGLDVDRVTALVPDTTRLNLELSAEGAGTDPNADLRGTFTLRSRDQVVVGESLPLLELDGNIADGVVSLDGFRAVHGAASVSAQGQIDLKREVVDLSTVDASVPTLAVLGRYGVPPMAGRAGYRGRVRVDGFGEDGVVLAEGNVSLAGFSMPDTVAVGALSGPVQARVELGTQAVSARGTTEIEGVEAPGTSVGTLALGWQADVVGGRVTAETSLELTKLSVGDGAVGIDHIHTPEGRRFRAGVDSTGEPWAVGVLTMSEMLFGTAGYEAEGGDIRVAFRDPDGDSGPEAGRIEVGFELDRQGDASFFDGEVHGDLVSGEWQIDNLVIAPSEDHRLVAKDPVRFTLVDGGARDISAALEGDVGSIYARGDWVPDTANGSTLELKVDQVNLELVAKLADLFVAPEKEGGPGVLAGLGGMASMSVKLDDAKGRDLYLDAVVDLDAASFPDAVDHVFLDAEVHGPISLPRLEARVADADDRLLAALTGQVPLTIVEGAPQLDCDRTVDLDAIVAPGNIQRFSATFPAAGELPEADLSAAVLVGGPSCDPNLKLVSSVSAPVGRKGERVRVDFDVQRDAGLLDIDGQVEWGLQRRVHIEGTAQTNLSAVFQGAFAGGEMPPTDELSTFASAFDLSISPLGIPIQSLAAFAELPRGIQGRISGGINISGEPSRPLLTGGLLWTEGAIGDVPLDQASFLMLPAEGGYSLDGRLLFAEAGGVNIDGFIPIEVDLDAGGDVDLTRPGLRVDLEAEGVPLAAIEGVVDGVSQVAGKLSIEGGVSGTIAAPLPAIEVKLQDGAALLEATGLLYSGVELDTEITAEQVTLRSFSLLSERQRVLNNVVADESKLRVSGRVGLDDAFGPTDIDLKVDADKFWVSDTKDLALKIDTGDSKRGRIRVKGDYPAIGVKGQIDVLEGRLSLDESAFQTVSDLSLDPVLVVHRREQEYSQGKVKPTDSTTDPTNQLSVDLAIDMTRGFVLEAAVPMDSSLGSVGASLSTASVNVEVSSQELLVGMHNGDISLVGDVSMDRGDVGIFGKVLDLSGGAITFTGKDYADPRLEVEAVLHTGKYGDVGAAVSGTVSDFDIAFTSDEYPDQTDIVSIMLFGKPASELGDSEGQAGQSQLGAALAMAANSGANSALSGTALSAVEFDQDAVKVGVPIGDRTFLSLERHMNVEDDENVMAVSLEWIISRQTYAEMVTGDRGQSSADIYMRWRF